MGKQGEKVWYDFFMDAKSFYQIEMQTKRLKLRIPKNEETAGLAKVLADGIQEEGQPHFMDDNLYGKSVEENTKVLKEFIEKAIYQWNKENWHIPFGVFLDDQPIGLVTIFSNHFPITKGFGCSYWIGLPYQKKGYGTEAFQALLSFGFDGLVAREAYVGAYSDNIPSLRLLEKLEFVFNGEYWMERGGKAIKDRRMRLPREKWQKPTDIKIDGLASAADLFI